MKRAAIEMANSSFQRSSHTSGHSHKHTHGQKAPIVGPLCAPWLFFFRRTPETNSIILCLCLDQICESFVMIEAHDF
jgi:hypothetical protein